MVDTGVRASHVEFRGKDGMTRVENGQTFENATAPVQLPIVFQI